MDESIKKITNKQLDEVVLRNTRKQLDEIVLRETDSMNPLGLTLPYQYLNERVDLSWNDLLYFIENDYLSPEAAVEFALAEIERNPEASDAVMDIAILRPEEVFPWNIKELIHKHIGYWSIEN